MRVRRRVRSYPAGSIEALAAGCRASLKELYNAVRQQTQPQTAYIESVRYTMRLLAIFIAARRIPSIRSVSELIRHAAESVLTSPDYRVYEAFLAEVFDRTGLGIFRPPDAVEFDTNALAAAIRSLLYSNNIPVEPIYFETLPLSWLGSIYQDLLTIKPDDTTAELRASRSHRKKRGVFFTPPSLITYILESVLSPSVESGAELFSDPKGLKVLDPAMGGGDFLAGTVNYLAAVNGDDSRARIAAECVYGVEVDPVSVDISRFGVWGSAAFAEGICDSLNTHLICADSLGAIDEHTAFNWQEEFEDVLQGGGFDAVVGNPPYIASKNGLRYAGAPGQSDSYLMYISEVIDEGLVREGGYFSMVLPDPMLVRENAAAVRRKLMSKWSMISLLHISGAFEDAGVANVVPVCRNSPASSSTFLAARIDTAADRRSFHVRPIQTVSELAYPVRVATVTAQQQCEILYLLEQGEFGKIIRRIHGDDIALSNYAEPFAPLQKLNVRAIYRGEEVGKAAILSETGDQPVLLGGQSIRPYEILWEGNTADLSWIRKPIGRYHSDKILIQKSSAHIVAALDHVTKRHPGYVFPQSVYGVELGDRGMDALYLLCILNSQMMNEYIHRTVTGYKLLQPQLEIEDIRALPIRRVNFITPKTQRENDLTQGIGIFERECLRIEGFSGLANFTSACLTGFPEKSDVVHDLLVYLGRETMALARANRKSPDAQSGSRLQVTRAAIDAVVWRLYSSKPAQMTLQW